MAKLLNHTHLTSMARNVILGGLLLSTTVSMAQEKAATPENNRAEIRIPIEAELQRYMLATERFLGEQNFDQANQYLSRAKALGVELPSSYFYFKGKVLGKQKKYADARMNFEEYVLRAEAEDKYYIESLEMITHIESIQPQQLDEKLIKKEMSWESDQSSDDSASYLKRITELYLATSAKDALIKHINALLSDAPYTGQRLIKEGDAAQGLHMSVSLGEDNKLVVQKTEHRDGAAQLMSFSTSIFGLSRGFQTKCDSAQLKCEIKHEETLNTWFEIANDEAAANEIAEAASALILLLQKEANGN